ncbi:hypothetical protein [Streptomyces griseocarneus]|uniref:hypothetical protein n=1 Tax=Streptomyces griseocarneus TaxID=51201 RepID=UPI00167DE49E|nr:hypothetical protein [Streptomyces griseocarneus]MBZ6476677.1 hypothetical protein [Streptomyces griseocarneus]GHG80272.1 hypothetical protein GCM10018779_61720 [Streptomyces griseocarneus]
MDDTNTARRIITEDEYQDTVELLCEVAGRHGTRLSADAVVHIMEALLASAGLLAPPPAPEPGTCTALLPDDQGMWWQCEEDPGHADTSHSDGEFRWTDEHPEAVPPQG